MSQLILLFTNMIPLHSPSHAIAFYVTYSYLIIINVGADNNVTIIV